MLKVPLNLNQPANFRWSNRYILLVSYFLLTWLSGYFGHKVINKLDLINNVSTVVPQHSHWFWWVLIFDNEKSGPKKTWNWTLVFKKSWKNADIWSKRCWKINQANMLDAVLSPLWSKLCSSTVTFTFVIVDNKACSFPVSCFGIKFIGQLVKAWNGVKVGAECLVY